MKLVLLLYAGPTRDRLHRIADSLGLAAHTDLGPVHGAGATGRHEGSRVFPGDGQAMIAAVDDARADRLGADLARLRAELPAVERLHAFLLPVDQLL